MSAKQEKILPPRKPAPCRPIKPSLERFKHAKAPQYFDAFPRDCEFAYMSTGYYATGYSILDVYKTEVDFSEYRNLTFLEDPKLKAKWGHFKSRIPYPENRVTDLPGTRDVHYKNYCLRNLTPESAMSWRKSITPSFDGECKEQNESIVECICEEARVILERKELR